LNRDRLVELIEALERQARRLAAVEHRLVNELDRRGTAHEYGCSSTAAMLRQLLRISPRAASARVAAARDLGPRQTLTGEPLEPIFARVAAAQRAGELSSEHARVVVAAVETLPAEVEHEHGAAVEQRLVDEARHLDPVLVATLARRIHGHLDPDGVLTSEDDHDRRRSASLVRHRDGSGSLQARFTPEVLVQWQAVLDSLSRPQPAQDGELDPRNPGQRTHDALGECAARLLAGDGLPASGGTATTVLLTMTADQLARAAADQGYLVAACGAADGGWADRRPTDSGPAADCGPPGVVTSAHGTVLSPAAALRLAGEACVIPVVIDGPGILAYGQSRRIASPGQRLALAARDGGCTFPGCDRPPGWTQAHHVRPWWGHGLTDLDNLCLLCAFHHREFERRGWQVVMRAGRPWWIPPAWLDPDQRLVRNSMHDRSI
jgi:hypothetical protein